MTTTADQLRVHSRKAAIAKGRDPWTPEKETFLRENYEAMSLTGLVDQLHVSHPSILKKLKEFGIASKPRPKQDATRVHHGQAARGKRKSKDEQVAAMSLHQRRNELLQGAWA